jgi:RNA polymerase sigma-70 factor (ECF subfamily)
MSDEELMLRVKYDDDQDAFKELYVRHSGRSLAICRRSSASEADDLNQKVWMRVWMRRKKFRDGEKFVAFLIVITHSVRIEDYRARQRRKEVQEDETDEGWLDWLAHQAEQSNRLAEFSEKVQGAWSRLSEEERELLQQVYVDKRSRKEIADELGISAPTLRDRLKRACDRFRQYLLEEGITLWEDS